MNKLPAALGVAEKLWKQLYLRDVVTYAGSSAPRPSRMGPEGKGKQTASEGDAVGGGCSAKGGIEKARMESLKSAVATATGL